MTEPIFWLALSFLLVAVCLTAVLVAAIPTLRELSRAARSVEKLFDTLYRELPPTLEAIRLTGLEISDLTDDISDGVESAGNVVKQVDQGFRSAQKQVQGVSTNTRSLLAGVKAAWKTLTKPSPKRRRRMSAQSRTSGQNRTSGQRGGDRHPPQKSPTVQYEHAQTHDQPIMSSTSSEDNPKEDTPITTASLSPETRETIPEDSLSSSEPSQGIDRA